MAGVGSTRAPAVAAEARDRQPSATPRDDEGPGAGALHRLLNRPSALDLLVGDAGALGKFRADMPDRMPSGTSALTLKVGDALNRLAARLGLPGERILGGNPALAPAHLPLPPVELPPGDQPRRTDAGLTTDAARPVCGPATDNHAAAPDRGNRTPDRAQGGGAKLCIGELICAARPPL